MWKNILFSDESSIKQFSARKYRVWRPPRARYKEKFITPTGKTSQLNDLGCISAKGGVGLYFLPAGSTINGPKYVELFKEKPVLYMEIQIAQCLCMIELPATKAGLRSNFLIASISKRLAVLETVLT